MKPFPEQVEVLLVVQIRRFDEGIEIFDVDIGKIVFQEGDGVCK